MPDVPLTVLLRCFDTVFWVSGRASGMQKIDW